jgi:TrmH family RNA methyltransferase
LKHITSGANAAVKRARRLLSKKARDTDDAFLIEGFILIEEAVRAGLELRDVFLREGSVNEDTASGLPPGLTLPAGARAAVLEASAFDSLSDTVTPKEAVAVAAKPAGPGIHEAEALLVLDRLQDPGNVGTLIRTAEAAGWDGIYAVKGTADPYMPKIVRAAAGALFRLPPAEGPEPEEACRALADAGYRIVALDMEGDAPYYEADLTGRVALVVGNEGGGVAEAFKEACDATAYIPMKDGAESLNAAVAASVAMYERRRQMHDMEEL